MKSHKHLLAYILRILISVSLIVLIIKQVDFVELVLRIRSMRVPVFMIAFLVWQVGVVQRAWRWQILLRGAGIEIPFQRLIALNYRASFFNVFLPTGYGGEVVRVIAVEQETRVSRGQAGSVTVFDRVVGSITAVIVAGVVIPFVWDFLPIAFRYGMILLGVVGVAMLAFLLKPIRFKKEPRFLTASQDSIFVNIYKALQQLQRDAIIKAVLVSFTHTFLMIFIHYLVGQSNGINVGIGYFAVFTPLVIMSALFPSIQGLGARESACVLLLGQLDVPPTQALLVGLGVNILNILTGLGAGFINLIGDIQKAGKEENETP